MDGYIDIQKSIIGSILMYPESIKDLYGNLKPEHFPHSRLNEIYRGMLYLYSNNKPVDIITVSSYLNTNGRQIESTSKFLSECVSSIVTAANVINHSEILINHYKEKKLREILSIGELESNVDDVIGQKINLLTDLAQQRESRSKTIADLMKEHKLHYFNKDYNPSFTYIGFPHLDDLIGGIEDTDLVVIGARPSVGKSAFATNIAANVSKTRKVMFYNLEMKGKQVLDRILSSESGVDFGKVRKAKEFSSEEEKESFKKAYVDILNNKNLIINDDGAKTVGDIRNECKFMDNLGMIIIDYLQLMKPETNRQGNRVQEVGEVSRGLKALAMELHVPIIALSQLNRSVEYRSEKEPNLADLRESGEIEQDCNIIMFIWDNDKENKSSKGFKVAKNRQGQTDSAKLYFAGNRMKFYEVDDGKHYPVKNNAEKEPERDEDGFTELGSGWFSQEELPFKDG